MWEFIKRNKFFGLNIQKDYDAWLSALMKHKVIQKLRRSRPWSDPPRRANSLGPAELLMNSGTDAQKALPAAPGRGRGCSAAA